MGKTTNQIEAHIDHVREDLGSNIHELERKVKSVTDWKQHFQTSPMTMLGVAFGGGILAAAVLRGRGRKRGGEGSFSDDHAGSVSTRGTTRAKDKALQTWDDIKGALIGVAATRFKDFVGELVPGFQEQFQRTEQNGSL